MLVGRQMSEPFGVHHLLGKMLMRNVGNEVMVAKDAPNAEPMALLGDGLRHLPNAVTKPFHIDEATVDCLVKNLVVDCRDAHLRMLDGTYLLVYDEPFCHSRHKRIIVLFLAAAFGNEILCHCLKVARMAEKDKLQRLGHSLAELSSGFLQLAHRKLASVVVVFQSGEIQVNIFPALGRVDILLNGSLENESRLLVAQAHAAKVFCPVEMHHQIGGPHEEQQKVPQPFFRRHAGIFRRLVFLVQQSLHHCHFTAERRELIFLVVGNAVELWQHAKYRCRCPFPFVPFKLSHAPYPSYCILHQGRYAFRDHFL